MDPDDAGETFCLVCWRKSVLYVLSFLAVLIVGFDVGSVYEEFKYWGYLKEVMNAPQYHAISGLPPYELFDDYVSEETREKYVSERGEGVNRFARLFSFRAPRNCTLPSEAPRGLVGI